MSSCLMVIGSGPNPFGVEMSMKKRGIELGKCIKFSVLTGDESYRT